MTRSVTHLRIDDAYLERLDAVRERLHLRSRAQAFDIGMPFLLQGLEEMANTLEETLERKRDAP